MGWGEPHGPVDQLTPLLRNLGVVEPGSILVLTGTGVEHQDVEDAERLAGRLVVEIQRVVGHQDFFVLHLDAGEAQLMSQGDLADLLTQTGEA